MYRPLLQLMSASSLAQVISFLVMPLITRMHTPDSLGEYQFFTTLALVITPIVSGSFAFAIKSSPSRSRAAINAKLAMQFSLICLVVLFVISPVLLFLLSGSALEWFAAYLPLLIIFVYLSANFQFAMAFLTNNRRYGQQSSYTVTRSLTLNSLKLVLSFFSKSGLSLIAALVFTEIFQLARVLKGNYKFFIKGVVRFRWAKFARALSRARTYPTYVTMTSVLGILMNWFPILITGVLYGPEYAGLLGLAFMVVNTPVFPFIAALRNICFGELARDKSHRKLVAVYRKSIIVSLVPAVLGLIVLGLYGEELFVLIFGDEWRVAGLYAFICFIPISLSFILSPVYTTLNHFFSFQKMFFLLNLICLLFGVSVTSLIGYYDLSFEVFLTGFAFSMSISHLAFFGLSVFLVLRKKEYAL